MFTVYTELILTLEYSYFNYFFVRIFNIICAVQSLIRWNWKKKFSDSNFHHEIIVLLMRSVKQIMTAIEYHIFVNWNQIRL